MASPVDFVLSLEIGAPPTRQLQISSRMSHKSAKGFVDAGRLVPFTNELSGQHKSDVLNSTLLAQRAADRKKYNRVTNTDEWYKFYVSVLGKLGWVIQNEVFEEYNTSGQSLQVSTALLDILQGILTENELDVVKRTLYSLKTSGNDAWWVVFDRKSSGPSKNGNFQITPCKEDDQDKA